MIENIFWGLLFLGAPLYTSCVLGLRPSAFFNEFLLIKKKLQVASKV
jgi:hypothetical protein